MTTGYWSYYAVIGATLVVPSAVSVMFPTAFRWVVATGALGAVVIWMIGWVAHDDPRGEYVGAVPAALICLILFALWSRAAAAGRRIRRCPNIRARRQADRRRWL